MPLSSLIERFRRGAKAAAPGTRAPSPSDIELLRTRARRRLIGMVVLVGAGVIGFPWLFETQPRPMSRDVRIVQAGQGGAVDADASSRAASGRVGQASRREAQVANITPPSADADASATAQDSGEPRVAPRQEAPAAPVARPQPKPAPEPKPASKEPARPAEKPADKKPEPKAAAKTAAKPDPASDTRYVVQFGAFADVNAARETRQKAERMGLKTYAQQVDTPQGKRIRVRLGPFADKAEAEKALATLRKGGLNGNILTL